METKGRHLRKILTRSLSTADELWHRSIPIFDMCSLCQRAPESLNHLFRSCSFARAVWFGMGLSLRMDNPDIPDFLEWLRQWIQGNLVGIPDDLSTKCTISIAIWAIWIQRNNAVFKRSTPNPLGVLKHIQHFTSQIIQASEKNGVSLLMRLITRIII